METQEAKLYSNNSLIRDVKLSSGDEFFINKNGTITVQVLNTIYKNNSSYVIEVMEYHNIPQISFKMCLEREINDIENEINNLN
jgi:hypothetical protein